MLRFIDVHSCCCRCYCCCCCKWSVIVEIVSFVEFYCRFVVGRFECWRDLALTESSEWIRLEIWLCFPAVNVSRSKPKDYFRVFIFRMGFDDHSGIVNIRMIWWITFEWFVVFFCDASGIAEWIEKVYSQKLRKIAKKKEILPRNSREGGKCSKWPNRNCGVKC